MQPNTTIVSMNVLFVIIGSILKRMLNDLWKVITTQESPRFPCLLECQITAHGLRPKDPRVRLRISQVRNRV